MAAAYEVKVGDRVAVSIDNQVHKARVSGLGSFGRVFVTRSKGETPLLVQPAQIFPLYRYVTVEVPQLLQNIGAPASAEVLQPLFYEKD